MDRARRRARLFAPLARLIRLSEVKKSPIFDRFFDLNRASATAHGKPLLQRVSGHAPSPEASEVKKVKNYSRLRTSQRF